MFKKRASSSPFRRAFTLIELLTVVAIIGLLASILVVAVQGAIKAANKAASQTLFGQWATALASYKSAYGFYPDLGTGYTSSADTYYTLDQGEIGQNFVRALSGRSMDGTALSDSQRKSLNSRLKEFCSFSNDAYQDQDPKTQKLADKFGNTKIRVVLDTDTNGEVTLKELPKNTTDLALQSGNRLNAKIVIYTLKTDGSDYEDIFAMQ